MKESGSPSLCSTLPQDIESWGVMLLFSFLLPKDGEVYVTLGVRL